MTSRIVMWLGLAGAMGLAACGDKVPPCGDPATEALVKQIFREQLLPAKWKALTKAQFDGGTRLELATPTKYEKEILKYQCEARFSVDASAGLDPDTAVAFALLAGLGGDVDELSRLVSRDDGSPRYKFMLTYSSQNVDGRHIVSVSGVNQLQLALTGAFLTAANAPVPTSSATPPPTAPPVVQAPAPASVTEVPAVPAAAPVAPASPVASPAAAPATATPSLEAPRPAEESAPRPPPRQVNAARQPEREDEPITPEDEFKEADKRLNQAYKHAMGMLTPDQQNSLRTEQRAWIKQRDAQCGPVDAPSANHACLTDLSTKRTTTLNSM